MLLMMLIFWVAGQAVPSGVATPYQSGGCGRCTGGMTIGTSVYWKWVPEKFRVSEVSPRISTSKASI